MYEITNSNENKDLVGTRHESRQFYLDLYGDFESQLDEPILYPSPERNDIFILDFAQQPSGLKAHGAEKLIATTRTKAFGYAAPRFGHASEAIAMLCELYNKRGIFFAAASVQVTAHQAVTSAYKGCELRFVKIPAMPTLNAWISKWAKEFGCTALPFGLANSPLVTAGLVAMCDRHTQKYGEPVSFYCATSTGTMVRALQIGWPNSQAYSAAVARNIKRGEKGEAEMFSYHKSFYKASDYIPKFDTTATYDAKVYKSFIDTAESGSIFINVGSDKQIESRVNTIPDWQNINGVREWGDQWAFNHL